MSTMSKKVSNELQKILKSYGKDIPEKALDSLEKSGKVLADKLATATRIRTGDTSKNWNSIRLKESIYVYNEAPTYRVIHLIEDGTVKMPARPFVKPTFENEEQNIINDLKNNLGG